MRITTGGPASTGHLVTAPHEPLVGGCRPVTTVARAVFGGAP
ncbi:hypothetical protein ACIPW9_30385 [Streptomyces sp. NPDC090052]|nr:hypothetical protein OG760_28290 [Streptomyces sp. NBC_00963]